MPKVASYDAQRAQVSLSLAGRMLTASDTMRFPSPPQHAMSDKRATATVTFQTGNRAERRKAAALARRMPGRCSLCGRLPGQRRCPRCGRVA
jgi:hypothetical protein